MTRPAPTRRPPRRRPGVPYGRRLRTRRRRAAVAAAAAVLVVAVVVGWQLLSAAGRVVSAFTTGCTTTVAASATGSYRLNTDQAQNASIISAVAIRLGLPDHAVTVALATALQESRLENLPSGDRDSVGLFQQRPSQGWGTRAQLLDPVYATTAFYGALVKIPGWETLAVTEAAQSVQHSAAPSAYATWEAEARALAVAFTGEVAGGLACHLHGFDGAPPAAGSLDAALSTEMGRQIATSVPDPATGWKVATWVVAHAYAYHVSRVAWDGQAWEPAWGSWRPAAAAASPAVQVTAAP